MKFIVVICLIFIIPYVHSDPKENELHWTQKIFLKEKKSDLNKEVIIEEDLVNNNYDDFNEKERITNQTEK